MNILIIGSGGREHTLAWKISQSALCNQLYVAPGNAGTAGMAHNLPLDPLDFEGIKKQVIEKKIELVVVGPEAPLVAGIRDFFEADEELQHIHLIGPGKEGAQLEGSKDFSKAFMVRHKIPTARAKTFTKETLEEGLNYLEEIPTPVVLKADGLAAGKGVLICQQTDEAKDALQEMLMQEKFGEAGKKVLIEEYLDGTELSVFVLTDGKDYLILPEAKDYKRIGEKDTGLNTGGMGAVSPVHIADKDFMQMVEDRVVKRTITGLQQEGIPFMGFLFIGLMKVKGEPFVIEYNVRMGDPETEVVIPRIENDLVDLFLATSIGKLHEKEIHTLQRAATTVVMVAGGYPEAYEKGHPISGLEETATEDTMVFHAGTTEKDGKLHTNGGRVLAVTGLGDSLKEALEKSYQQVEKINWKNRYYRRDIGQDVIL
ncbi:phosphoribosylamine--glycine ligase [Nafulsella turpanensis]|uniref:phosphoribosylamine--glycine ligase n=1 Tax=Nafulsella turpanensis TaxID=1265690 RepID=UPI00034594AF|nr:phosphoribosylamine--glycine ligase [Nafulsella turpanensis]